MQITRGKRTGRHHAFVGMTIGREPLDRLEKGWLYIAESREEKIFLTKLQNKVQNRQTWTPPLYPEPGVLRAPVGVVAAGGAPGCGPCGQDSKVQVTEKTKPAHLKIKRGFQRFTLKTQSSAGTWAPPEPELHVLSRLRPCSAGFPLSPTARRPVQACTPETSSCQAPCSRDGGKSPPRVAAAACALLVLVGSGWVVCPRQNQSLLPGQHRVSTARSEHLASPTSRGRELTPLRPSGPRLTRVGSAAGPRGPQPEQTRRQLTDRERRRPLHKPTRPGCSPLMLSPRTSPPPASWGPDNPWLPPCAGTCLPWASGD